MKGAPVFRQLLLLSCSAVLLSQPATAQRTPAPTTRESQERLAPPAGLKCDPNGVTSFTGRVLAYSRRRGRIFVRVRTDEETTESFTIKYGPAEGPERYFLLNGSPLTPTQLKAIERGLRRRAARMRLTVWACYLDNGRRLIPELIDWRPVEE